jgi:hypothetical protein
MAIEMVSLRQSCGNVPRCSARWRQKAMKVTKRQFEFTVHHILYWVGSGSFEELLKSLWDFPEGDFSSWWRTP